MFFGGSPPDGAARLRVTLDVANPLRGRRERRQAVIARERRVEVIAVRGVHVGVSLASAAPLARTRARRPVHLLENQTLP